MVKLAYNNAKNADISHTPFELNYGFYPQVLFQEDVNPPSRSCFANKLANKLKRLIEICYQNLLYIQKLQKKAYDKGIKSCS